LNVGKAIAHDMLATHHSENAKTFGLVTTINLAGTLSPAVRFAADDYAA
jgi:hypothetical protein